MPYFRSPRVIFGRGALGRLSRELKGTGAKAMVVTDRTMARAAEPVMEALGSAGLDVRLWDGARPDPTTELALEGSQALSEFAPQWIVGFGGGSAIDTAKAAWVFYERPELADGDLSKTVIPKVQLDLRQKARFAAVPTTSGTGADVTWVAVLSDPGSHRKIVFAHNDLVPDLAVLDPELTLALPPELTASTGIDVLAHAIDGYTSRQANDFADGLCLQAAKLAFAWLPRAVRDGTDRLSREKMQNAATIAGLGFGNSNTGLSHALGHAAGAVFEIPHGRAVGIALPYSLEYLVSHPPLPKAPVPIDRLDDVARFVGVDATSPEQRVTALIESIRSLQCDIGEPMTLREAGVSKQRLDEAMDLLVSLGQADPNMMTTPCECPPEELEALFRRMWTGAETKR